MNFSIFEKIVLEKKDFYDHAEIKHGLLELKTTSTHFFPLIKTLQNDFDFDIFLDVTAIDYLNKRPIRFEIVHHFYSTKHFVRIRTKVPLDESAPNISSLTKLYGSSHFMERECHEMYGIQFVGNSDLRPILLYEGFIGHPLKKDYPIEKEQPIVAYRK